MSKLLDIRNLEVMFDTDEGSFKAVDDVSFTIQPGEIVGLVGESGCGKSVTALSILRLIPCPPGKISRGTILFRGTDLIRLPPKEMRAIRGRHISMIFQEPSAALSPLHRVGNQMIETVQLHRDVSYRDAWDFSESWLKKVRIPDAAQRMLAYPYQLSGGMQQRIMIAMALMMEPAIVIADEPTTALDVTIQAQIFDLIRGMKQNETAILLITHDLGVVWEMCDRVIVMYASKIVETGSRDDVFTHPMHPYTKGLLNSIPRLTGNKGELSAIPGQVPSPFDYPAGCHFRDRCPVSFDLCGTTEPPLVEINEHHRAACLKLHVG